MNKLKSLCALFYIMIVVMIFLAAAQNMNAAEKQIYFLEENYTEILQPEIVNDHIMVQAGPLAEMLGAYVEWQKTLQTIEMIDEKSRLRFMTESLYYEVDGEAKKAAEEVYISQDIAYLPLEETVKGFGYLTFISENEFHIFKPGTELKEVYWEKEERKMSLEMTEPTAVKIIPGDDPNSLVFELDNAVLAEDFTDNVSDPRYNLGIRETSEDAVLRLRLSSSNPLAVSRFDPVEEQEERTVINFSPTLIDIVLDDNKLEVKTNAALEIPEVYAGEDPGRIIVEIQNLTVTDVNLDLSDNEYLREIKVNYYYREPVFTRIELEFENGKYFGWNKTDSEKNLLFSPVDQSEFLGLSAKSIQDIEDLEPALSIIFNGDPVLDEEIDFAGGSGTEDDPYLVENSHHLYNIRYHLDKNFKQTADIDLKNYQEGAGWQPLGSYFDKFTGFYDGNKNIISNLKIDRPDTDFVGLFGYLDSDSVIQGVVLENVNITGQNSVGSLAGRNWQGSIITSSAKGVIKGEKSVGGLIGYNFMGGTIQGSYAEFEVIGYSQIGGLVGYNQGAINNSYAAEGLLKGEEYLGGLVGYNSQGKISNSYAAMIVKSSSDKTGGLLGKDWEELGNIFYSYYDKNLVGQNTSNNPGIPLGTEKMRQRSTYDQHWDFIFVWQIDDGESYPFLRWSR